MKYTAKKDQVAPWLAKIAEKYTFLAPKAKGKAISFKGYSASELASIDVDSLLDFTTNSMKNAYIPETEVLFTYKSEKNPENLAQLSTALTCVTNTEQKVIFGARPCDAKGVEVQDAAYLGGKYKDPYYKANRDNTCIITQACNQVLPSCFCNWAGTDLATAYASDILFTVTDNGFVFEAITDKGKELLALASFSEASDADTKAATEQNDKARAALSAKPDLSNLPAIIGANFENNAFWQSVSSGCIGCSSCTFVCPTCQCFTITDEGNPLEGKRMRSWASCMGDEFTREASGHNPRSLGYTRWRQRLGHKFNYMTTMHTGLNSCTGCGRCLLSCPASISIKDMISQIIEIPCDISASAQAPQTEAPVAEAAKKPAAKPAQAQTKKTAKKG